MKIYCISWKDERWSADKEALRNINEIINSNRKHNMNNWGEKVFLAIGWVAISPFILRDLIIEGFKCLLRKIKK